MKEKVSFLGVWAQSANPYFGVREAALKSDRMQSDRVLESKQQERYEGVEMYDTDKRKLLSALCHGSIFFSATLVSIGIPIAVLFVSDDPVVKDNAKEALNFHINLWIYGAVFGVLTLVLIGWLLLGLLGLFNLVLPILAILKALGEPDQPYRYPFIFRIL